MSEREYQTIGGPVEVRAEKDGGVRVSGYAAVFGERANIAGIFTETITRGAFDESLERGDDVTFLVEHDGLPLARTESGTLSLAVDEHGLRMETTLRGDDPDVRSIIPKMERGDLSKMSIGFTIEAGGDRWERGEDPPHRTITRARLYDVSVVGRPAYKGTEIALRSLDDARSRVVENPPPLTRRARIADADALAIKVGLGR